MFEKVREGAWTTVQRNFDKLVATLIDTGGQSVGIRFGTDTLSFSAAAASATKTITHGLGKTPVAVFAMSDLSTEYIVINSIAASFTDTQFQVKAQTASGSSITQTPRFYWLAIG